jgi:hypothetical protein
MDEATPGSAAAPHTTASTSSLDLDALERLADFPGFARGTAPVVLDGTTWKRVIQRLREAEARQDVADAIRVELDGKPNAVLWQDAVRGSYVPPNVGGPQARDVSRGHRGLRREMEAIKK